MRKFKMLVLMVMTISCICLGLVACNKNADNNEKYLFKDNALVQENPTTYTYNVSNSSDNINFSELITEDYINTFRVFLDIEGKQELITKASSLSEGNNVFYIFDGIQTYALNVYRNKIIDVNIKYLVEGIDTYNVSSFKYEENTNIEYLDFTNYIDIRYYDFICFYKEDGVVSFPILARADENNRMEIEIKAQPKRFTYYISNGKEIVDEVKVYGYAEDVVIYNKYSTNIGHPNTYQKLGYTICGCKILSQGYSYYEENNIIKVPHPLDFGSPTIEILYRPIDFYFSVPGENYEIFIKNYQVLGNSNMINIEILNKIELNDIIGLVYKDGNKNIRITSAKVVYTAYNYPYVSEEITNNKNKLSDYINFDRPYDYDFNLWIVIDAWEEV